jgi:hypothetical protein
LTTETAASTTLNMRTMSKKRTRQRRTKPPGNGDNSQAAWNTYLYDNGMGVTAKKKPKKRKKKKQQQSNTNSFNAYHERNELLKDMGYPSYAHYLRSPTWARIRTETLKRNNFTCFRCSQRAQTAHHLNYSKNTLLGLNKGSIVAICFDCHRQIEHKDSGRKATIREANQAIGLPKDCLSG